MTTDKKAENLIYSMLMENTGVAMMDSGGDEGRAWQRNAKRDIRKDAPVSLEFDAPCQSDDVQITVSLYHYLPTVLELDEQCEAFNEKFAKMENWDSDIYGVSDKARTWLRNHKFEIGDSWNSYNGESNLSQVLQGTEIKRDGVGYGDYVLLQIHGGADVRGGYTDAKMFKYQRFQETIDTCPRVSGLIIRGDAQDGATVDLEMRDSGYGFVDADTGEVVEIRKGDTVTADLI